VKGPRVVVIGAGAMGVSAGWHLLQQGAGDVTIIESGESPAVGTTFAGAGFVDLWSTVFDGHFSPEALPLQTYSIDLYRRIAERDSQVQLRERGTLFIALSDQEQAETLEPLLKHPLAHPSTREVSPREIHELTRLVDASAVHSGVLHATGIQVEASAAVTALADWFAELGGRLVTGATATSVVAGDAGVEGVRTTTDFFEADAVVLACGAWTNKLLQPFGIRLPLERYVATRIITPPVGAPADMPTLEIGEFSALWMRGAGSALTYGNTAGYRPWISARDGEPSRRPELEALAKACVDDVSARMARVMPGVDLSASTWVQGTICYTPDRTFLTGAVPEVPGLFVSAGCNEGFVSHAPGLGRALADLVVEGVTDFADVSPYRVDRFGKHTYIDEEALPASPWAAA
jgi:sarcosine oxidase subunit beta